jgi:hypothetical protein
LRRRRYLTSRDANKNRQGTRCARTLTYEVTSFGEKSMTNIRRYESSGQPVFITAACYRRKPFLKTDWQNELLLSVMLEEETDHE